MNVLVVDDHVLNRKLLRAQLEAEEISVVEAADGVEALEVLAREAVSAVISDILMPRMDGYRLCHEVRKHPALRELRFLLYSSTYTSPGDVRLSDTVGADQFIAKPASVELILAALRVTASPRSPASAPPDEAGILQKYSEVLVKKLGEKNSELHHALDASRRANDRILELNNALEQRVRERTAELVAANSELTVALGEVKQLRKLLPICCYCKSIRDEKESWDPVENFITRHTDSHFSHGICPACYEKHVTPMLYETPRPPSAAAGDPPGAPPIRPAATKPVPT
ncbi:MAG: domain S-box protein [Verrucomicrobia bacterium]|nr:domain S-box protein [Verrucomicrobiota bacterium]